MSQTQISIRLRRDTSAVGGTDPPLAGYIRRGQMGKMGRFEIGPACMFLITEPSALAKILIYLIISANYIIKRRRVANWYLIYRVIINAEPGGTGKTGRLNRRYRMNHDFNINLSG